MKIYHLQTSRVAFVSAFSVMLAGCFGGGTTSIDTLTTSITKDTSSSLEKLDNVKGTIGYAMDIDETVFQSKEGLSSGMVIDSTDNSVTVGEGPIVTVRKNFIGGVDMDFDGRSVSLRDEEAVAGSHNSWLREYGSGTTQFSLSLWNAGKGGREGLTQNEAGQNYHKIIGYDAISATDGRQRGHIVFGQQSALATVAKLERTATFEGYFNASIVPETLNSASKISSEAEAIAGGIELLADFDNNTISGYSTNISRRPSEGIEFKEEVFDVQFEETQIKNDGAGGVIYTGNMSSTYEPINGAQYSGTFYGDQAQETAGVIQGATTDSSTGDSHVVDGFFSAAR